MQKSDVISHGQLHGHLIIESVHAVTGEVLDRWEKKNVITIQSQQALISAVSIPSPNCTINKIKVGKDLGELMSGSPSVTFTASGNTIVRSTGSWVTDGFAVNDFITVSGTSGTNDTSVNGVQPPGFTGVLQVSSISTTTNANDTLNLFSTGTATLNGVSYPRVSVVNQTVGTGCVISRGNVNSPSAPLSSYTQTTMNVLFNAPYILGAGSINSTTAAFSVTIVGQDVLNAIGGGATSAVFTSAALHVGNGNVFAYQRFPQKSVSSVVNVNITWQIGY